MSEEKTSYDQAREILAEAEKNGHGFMLCVDRGETSAMFIDGVSVVELAQFVHNVIQRHPEIGGILLAEQMRGMKDEKDHVTH